MTLYSYLITLHYIFSYLWVENRIFNKFKEFDLGWYCQRWSQVLLFTWFFTHNIISNKCSQHWQAAWNQSAGRGLDSTGIDGQSRKRKGGAGGGTGKMKSSPSSKFWDRQDYQALATSFS